MHKMPAGNLVFPGEIPCTDHQQTCEPRYQGCPPAQYKDAPAAFSLHARPLGHAVFWFSVKWNPWVGGLAGLGCCSPLGFIALVLYAKGEGGRGHRREAVVLPPGPRSQPLPSALGSVPSGALSSAWVMVHRSPTRRIGQPSGVVLPRVGPFSFRGPRPTSGRGQRRSRPPGRPASRPV